MSDTVKHLVNTHEASSGYSCEQIFKLLCPVENSKWVPGWRERCEMIYSESGTAEDGCVFRVHEQPYLMGTTVLVNTLYQPHEKIRYTAINDHLVYNILWRLLPLDTGCQVSVTRTWTALSTEAVLFLADMARNQNSVLLDLLALAEHYLRTGEMGAS